MTTRLKPALIVLVAACHEAPVESCPAPRVAGISAERAAPVARPSPFDSVFQAAGTEFDVSPALLKAIGWVATRWQMIEGREEFAGRPPVFGVMALGGTALERGAALAGVSVEAGRRDAARSEEHTSELQSPDHLVCRLLLEKKNKRDRPQQHRRPLHRPRRARNDLSAVRPELRP